MAHRNLQARQRQSMGRLAAVTNLQAFGERKQQQRVVVTDRRGRQIALVKPSARALCRLLEILGESGKNQMYFAIVAPLMFVREIDGEDVPLPDSKTELEALLDKLEEDGIKAIMQGLKSHFSHPALLRQSL
jgi:hypothetical protein